jgi:hypothetical protein
MDELTRAGAASTWGVCTCSMGTLDGSADGPRPGVWWHRRPSTSCTFWDKALPRSVERRWTAIRCARVTQWTAAHTLIAEEGCRAGIQRESEVRGRGLPTQVEVEVRSVGR